MAVTRSMSGATKKADTKVSVSHKAAERERARKEKMIERERAREEKMVKRRNAELAWRERKLEQAKRSIQMNEKKLYQKAAEIFLSKTFLPQYWEEKGDKIYDIYEVHLSGFKTFATLDEKEKNKYRAMAKKWEEEQIASAKRRIMGYL